MRKKEIVLQCPVVPNRMLTVFQMAMWSADVSTVAACDFALLGNRLPLLQPPGYNKAPRHAAGELAHFARRAIVFHNKVEKQSVDRVPHTPTLYPLHAFLFCL